MIGVKTRLKDVSNALTTSKELLKIINRMWGHEDRPSSSMSLISALHAELERGRLQINQLIQEHRSDQNEINYLMKCFAEEKAAWENKEQKTVEAAIESVAGELEVERKLRRRFESLNKKLGKELSDTKESLSKVVKELESEKRAREIIEQVCDELANDVSEDKAKMKGLRRESAKVYEEAERVKEIMQLADKLHEERAQMKLSEAQYEIEEKNVAVDQLRDQLEAFLGNKNVKDKVRGPCQLNEEELASYLRRGHLASYKNETCEEDAGEVDNGTEFEEESGESDLHSIELNMDNDRKSYMWNHNAGGPNPQRYSVDEVNKGRKSASGKVIRRSSSLQRSISDGIEWERLIGLEKPEKGYGDEMQGYKSVKGLRDHLLPGSRLAPSKVQGSPNRHLWPPRDPTHAVLERTALLQGNSLRPRGTEAKGEGLNARKSKREAVHSFN